MTAHERFQYLVEIDEDTRCWIWQGGKVKGGYGVFTPTPGRSMLAHRWSYEFHVGELIMGHEIDHECNTPACVNPAHLVQLDADEHQRRTLERRTACGNGHEYTPETVRMTGGVRRCRICEADRARKYRERKRGKKEE